MAINIDLNVQSGAFNEFQQKFNSFHDALKALPEAWKKASVEAKKIQTSFEAQTEQISKQVGLMDDLTRGSERFMHVSTQTAHMWGTMARNTMGVASNIAAATESLLKWAGVTSIIGGLMGGGALFGLDRLAESVSGQRTTALATGSTIGKGRSADIAYGRFVGSGFGGRIANMIHDPEQAHWIESVLGRKLGPNEDPNDIEGELLQKGSAQAKRDGKDKYMQDPALNAIFSKGESTTLFGANESEIGEAQSKYKEYASGNKFETQDAKAWQDFLRTLEETKRTLETSFINRLTAIAPDVDKLIQSFKNLAVKVINSDAFSDAIKLLDDGVQWLSKELEEPEFQKSVLDLIKGAADLAKGIGGLVAGLAKVAHFFGIDAGGTGTGTPGSVTPGGKGEDGKSGSGQPSGNKATAPDGSLGSNWTGGKAGDFKQDGSMSNTLNPDVNKIGTGSNSPSGGGNLTDLITASANKYGIDPRVMEGIRAGESGHKSTYDKKDDALESSWGPFQLNRRRGLGQDFERETGLDVRDPSTIPAQSDWVANYIKKHHGTNGQWMGYHGPRDADPHWGDSGYKPAMPKGAVPETHKVKTTKEKPMSESMAHPRGNQTATNVTVTRSVGGNPTNLVNAVANQG